MASRAEVGNGVSSRTRRVWRYTNIRVRRTRRLPSLGRASTYPRDAERSGQREQRNMIPACARCIYGSHGVDHHTGHPEWGHGYHP